TVMHLHIDPVGRAFPDGTVLQFVFEEHVVDIGRQWRLEVSRRAYPGIHLYIRTHPPEQQVTYLDAFLRIRESRWNEIRRRHSVSGVHHVIAQIRFDRRRNGDIETPFPHPTAVCRHFQNPRWLMQLQIEGSAVWQTFAEPGPRSSGVSRSKYAGVGGDV